MEKSDNLVLRTRVETARHLIAEQDFGLARHFHRQSEPPTLAAGEDLHTLIGEFLHAHLGEQLVHSRDPVHPLRVAHAQTPREFDTLANCEFLMGDTELRDIRDFGGEEILRFQIASLPKNRALLVAFNDSRDQFEQCRLAASRRADNGAKVSERKTRRDMGEKFTLALG